tara:strand:- start:3310 stop:3681 length:372 start_codon:yes stop_codon:yes gene_type:complete
MTISTSMGLFIGFLISFLIMMVFIMLGQFWVYNNVTVQYPNQIQCNLANPAVNKKSGESCNWWSSTWNLCVKSKVTINDEGKSVCSPPNMNNPWGIYASIAIIFGIVATIFLLAAIIVKTTET